MEAQMIAGKHGKLTWTEYTNDILLKLVVSYKCWYNETIQKLDMKSKLTERQKMKM
jgi:hypothetical protein